MRRACRKIFVTDEFIRIHEALVGLVRRLPCKRRRLRLGGQAKCSHEEHDRERAYRKHHRRGPRDGVRDLGRPLMSALGRLYLSFHPATGVV
eukprot:scaffold18951_cov63-Phaeocystis_antarctica.AAC.5